MTQIYFVRHAEPNYRNHVDAERELSERGLEDRKLVTHFLLDKEIDLILSSPYRRAVETVRHFADTVRMPVIHIQDFREREVADEWIDDFNAFSRHQWEDFDFSLPGGECLREVQKRNVEALAQVLREHSGKRIVIGGHGTSISTVLNYYDHTFGHTDFERIRRLMPWIVRLDFEGQMFLRMESFQLK